MSRGRQAVVGSVIRAAGSSRQCQEGGRPGQQAVAGSQFKQAERQPVAKTTVLFPFYVVVVVRLQPRWVCLPACLPSPSGMMTAACYTASLAIRPDDLIIPHPQPELPLWPPFPPLATSASSASAIGGRPHPLHQPHQRHQPRPHPLHQPHRPHQPPPATSASSASATGGRIHSCRQRPGTATATQPSLIGNYGMTRPTQSMPATQPALIAPFSCHLPLGNP